MKRDRLTQQQIYEIECAIYNDDNKALFKAIPSAVEEKIVKNNNAEAIADGQPYIEISDTDYILRKDGRVFNTKFIRTIKPMWTPHHFIIHKRYSTVTFKELYEEMGWEYDHGKLTLQYKDNDWGIVANKQYKVAYNQFELEVHS